MQGRRAVGSMSEVLDFEHGSTSSDGSLDQQNFWSGVSNLGQPQFPNFMVSSMDSSFRFSNSPNQQEPGFGRWDFGESSSSSVVQNEGSLIDLKTEHGWSAPINVVSNAQHYGPSNLVSMNNVHVDLQSDRIEDPFVQNFVANQPQGFNLNSVLEEDDDCQVIEFPNVYKSRGSRNQPIRFRNPSQTSNGTESYLIEENNVRAGSSSDGRRSSRKRKIIEESTEQPSMVESSSYRPNASGSSSIAAPVENNNVLNFNILPEPVNRRCSSSVRQMACENPPLLANSGTTESSSRNVRLRINSTHQQGSLAASSIVSTENIARNINPNSEAQPGVVRDSFPRRNLQSSRNAASGLRRRNFSSISVSSERAGTLFDDSNSQVLPRNISGHPMFTPSSDPGSSLQTGPVWGLSGGNVNNPGILGPTSESAIAAAPPSVDPSWIHQSFSQYQHRSSVTENSSNPSLNSIPFSHEMSLPSGSIRRDRQSQSRSAMLLERNPDGALRIPNSLRALAAANGGRRRLMSEQLRNVLDLVRRGEGLRFEDMLLLQQSSIIFGMTDGHDQHRDMRLDVDNMSYEELLALEERIGSVSTGLSEEIIIKQLKQKRVVRRMMDEAETEPCCICQEEYKDGEDLGTLDCGHDFHGVCIKKWLMQKNLCPICKTTGLSK